MPKKSPITSSKTVKITKTPKKSMKSGLRIPTVSDDFRSAALVVSLLMNLFVLVAWAVLELNGDYIVPVANFLFN